VVARLSDFLGVVLCPRAGFIALEPYNRQKDVRQGKAPPLFRMPVGRKDVMISFSAPSGVLTSAILGTLMIQTAAAQVGPVQRQALASSGFPAVEAGISETMLTFKNHQVNAGATASNLEGESCPTNFKMIAGSCHPSYNDQVPVVNQFPNIALNTWRCGFKNNTTTSVGVWVYTHCARSGLANVAEHRLNVRRFTTAALTNADADRIMADSTTVLQTNDGTGDVECATSFIRDGDVTVFADGDGSIDSQAEFSTLIGLPGHVKVVNQINWCGGLIPNVIGCAPVPGASLAIVRYTPALEGILWAHEYGHNKGLSHRNDDPNAVMNGTIGSTRQRVNAGECTSFRTLPVLALAAERIMPSERPAGPMDVREFVRQVFIHGVPYEEASRYGAAAIPVLLDMLKDPAERQHWANIAVTLAMSGDDRVVEPLISFIEMEDPRGLSRDHYAAKTSALMSLGYVINRTGNQQALDYLKQSVNPETWATKRVGVAPFQSSITERNQDLSKHAILGLALSGRPEAAELLRTLQRPADNETQRAFQAQVSDLVSEALKENERIATQGIEGYYRERGR
jgi:hypothetical protein